MHPAPVGNFYPILYPRFLPLSSRCIAYLPNGKENERRNCTADRKDRPEFIRGDCISGDLVRERAARYVCMYTSAIRAHSSTLRFARARTRARSTVSLEAECALSNARSVLLHGRARRKIGSRPATAGFSSPAVPECDSTTVYD